MNKFKSLTISLDEYDELRKYKDAYENYHYVWAKEQFLCSQSKDEVVEELVNKLNKATDEIEDLQRTNSYLRTTNQVLEEQYELIPNWIKKLIDWF
jgi:hypothetical protein